VDVVEVDVVEVDVVEVDVVIVEATTTVPSIGVEDPRTWRSQMYGYVPAMLNV